MFAGVDIGSVTSKAVLLGEDGRILAFTMRATGFDRNLSGQQVLADALDQAGESAKTICRTVSTGYGRKAFQAADKAVTEILCHAEGTRFIMPDARTIIDIGGQDSKVIELDANGHIRKFQMNDKCAAGTGRFLEVLSEKILKIDIDQLGAMALKSASPCMLSSICTVFAESEIVSYLSEGRPREDIAAGLSRAIAKRVVGMGRADQVPYTAPVCFSGGVANNSGVRRALSDELAKPVVVPDNPQITASLGAAVLARRQGLSPR